MDNSYFLYSNDSQDIEIERFHICIWEFNNSSTLVEFGFEIVSESITGKDKLDLELFIPWLKENCEIEDFYQKLKGSENSRFIFNDSIKSTNSLDGGDNLLGVVHHYNNRNELCILPVDLKPNYLSHYIKTHIDLTSYKKNLIHQEEKPNIYIRFCVKPKESYVSIRKKGISKSTIIYDVKLNEKRNIPEQFLPELAQKNFCNVNSCFCFNIIPNSYDLAFFDSASLKNVRTLEYDSFNKYLDDSRIKKDELLVVFYKKKKNDPFSFFAMYTKERIGAGQFALTLLVGIICGLLLYIPSYRTSFEPQLGVFEVWLKLPVEVYLALSIAFITVLLFVGPWISIKFKNAVKWVGR